MERVDADIGSRGGELLVWWAGDVPAGSHPGGTAEVEANEARDSGLGHAHGGGTIGQLSGHTNGQGTDGNAGGIGGARSVETATEGGRRFGDSIAVTDARAADDEGGLESGTGSKRGATGGDDGGACAETGTEHGVAVPGCECGNGEAFTRTPPSLAGASDNRGA